MRDLSEEYAASTPSRVQLVGVHVLFFASGVASLICEVVWFKQLQFAIGSSTYSVSVVVACFFGGLAFGSWLVGRLADQWRDPLRAYALLELSLAVASAAVTLLLSFWATWVEWLAPWLGPQSAVAKPIVVALSFLVLIVPTSLMGATLPVLAKYLVREHGQLAGRIGTLYGVNTLGGATGCFLVGFLLIGRLGVAQSALVASALYTAIAVAALALWRGVARPNGERLPAPGNESATLVMHQTADGAGRLLLIAFSLMGFASIAYEVVWFRLLTYFGVHTVYAFSGMLGVYLIGLVLGSFLSARFLAPRKDRHLLLLARAQLLLGLAAMCSLALLGRARDLTAVLLPFDRWLGGQEWWFVQSGMFAFLCFCLIVLLVPTTIIGVSLPLVAELTTQRLSGIGTRLGLLYSLNTLGGVLGSLLAGFVLLPLLGSQWSFLAVVLLTLSLFVVLMASQHSLRANRVLWREGALTFVGVTACFVGLGPNYLKQALTNYPGAAVLAFRENPDATFVVLQYETPGSGLAQQLIVNGASYANNSPFGRRYMGTLGHLPALLHPDPKSAVVICVGTGTTVGSLTLHPELEQVWAVDIAGLVFDLAPHFVPINNRFHSSPKARMLAADGRHFLLCTEHQFDVLTFEPPPPQEAGVVNLYSREFYQLAKRRMKPGAILCQWVPLELDQDVMPRMLIETIRAEFPHVSLWIPNHKEGVVIASHEPLRIDLERMRRRLADPRLRADLAAYGLAEPEQIAATFFAADDALARYVGSVPLVTDNQPRIEYYRFRRRKPMRYQDILPYREAVEKYLVRPPTDSVRLKECVAVIQHIWFNHELTSDQQFAEAAAQVDQALRLDPSNRYLLYLRARLEK